jgi:excisionase family DNA binding protein
MEPRNRAERRQPDRLAYSPAEAAEKIGISRAKLYELLEKGTLPSLKLDRRRLIRHEALVGLLDGLEGGGRVA